MLSLFVGHPSNSRWSPLTVITFVVILAFTMVSVTLRVRDEAARSWGAMQRFAQGRGWSIRNGPVSAESSNDPLAGIYPKGVRGDWELSTFGRIVDREVSLYTGVFGFGDKYSRRLTAIQAAVRRSPSGYVHLRPMDSGFDFDRPEVHMEWPQFNLRTKLYADPPVSAYGVLSPTLMEWFLGLPERLWVSVEGGKCTLVLEGNGGGPPISVSDLERLVEHHRHLIESFEGVWASGPVPVRDRPGLSPERESRNSTP